MIFDAIVIGGGPAGAAASLRLAKARWQVAVVERDEFPRRKVCGEFLSATNWELFAKLGVSEVVDALSGPEIARVAVYDREKLPVTAPLPMPQGTRVGYGRALTRDRLDTLLIEAANDCGAHLFQPMRCTNVQRRQKRWLCSVVEPNEQRELTLEAAVLIAANGSWTPASAPLPQRIPAARPSDLFGFKAHFIESQLPMDLMPLLAFPGGYGGMVTCQAGLVSLSCCIRRDVLTSLRNRKSTSAGEEVLDHISYNVPVVRDVLNGAQRQGKWLSTGPIRPGVRKPYSRGVFSVGNAAGEAHPVVAEGISMAIQSSWLAAESLLAGRDQRPLETNDEVDSAGHQYARLWRQSFASRIRASTAIATWAMRPAFVQMAKPIIRRWPGLLTAAARLAGKSHVISFPEHA